MTITTPARSSHRFSQRGQSMVEMALVLPLAIAVIILTLSMEFAGFQIEELHDATDAAVHAAAAPCDPNASSPTARCVNGYLDALRHAAPGLPIPMSSSVTSLPATCALTGSYFVRCSVPTLTFCIRAEPSFFSPSAAVAVFRYTRGPLGPVPFFALNPTYVVSTTTSADGVPGAPEPVPATCP